MDMNDDFLSDSAALFGEEPHDDGIIRYGPLTLTVAPKVRLEKHSLRPSLNYIEIGRKGTTSVLGHRFSRPLNDPSGKYSLGRSFVFTIAAPRGTHREEDYSTEGTDRRAIARCYSFMSR